MADVFRPNQLIELELNTTDQYGAKDCYTSRIEEVFTQYLLVAAPIKNGRLVLITPGETITLRLHLNGVLYSGLCRVQSRSNKGIAMLKISRPEEITRVQLRSFVRIDVLMPIEYRMAGYNIDYYNGITADLSGGGLMMVTEHPIDLDTLLDLRLKLGDDFVLECQGQVTRCLQDQTVKKRYKIGIKYEQLDEPIVEKIVAFVFMKQRESLKKGSLMV